MPHTDKNYENQINSINEKLVKMGSILEQQFSDALKVVLKLIPSLLAFH
jgi:hypothetical protein